MDSALVPNAQNATTEEQVVAILRRAEKQALSKTVHLNIELIEYRMRCGKIERALRHSQDLVESVEKDKKKLASQVKGLEARLDIARKDASRNEAKLKSTEAQVNALLAEKQKSLDERADLFDHVSELEVACQRFRRRAIQRGRNR